MIRIVVIEEALNLTNKIESVNNIPVTRPVEHNVQLHVYPKKPRYALKRNKTQEKKRLKPHHDMLFVGVTGCELSG